MIKGRLGMALHLDWEVHLSIGNEIGEESR